MERMKSKIAAQGQASVSARIRRWLGLKTRAMSERRDIGDQAFAGRAPTNSSRDIHGAVFETPPNAGASSKWMKAFGPGRGARMRAGDTNILGRAVIWNDPAQSARRSGMGLDQRARVAWQP